MTGPAQSPAQEPSVSLSSSSTTLKAQPDPLIKTLPKFQTFPIVQAVPPYQTVPAVPTISTQLPAPTIQTAPTIPSWIQETINSTQRDTRRQPWKATFGETVDMGFDNGEDLVTVPKRHSGILDPLCPFRTQGSSLAA